MDDNWDDSPSGFEPTEQNGGGFDDPGRNFNKGRGFSKSSKSNDFDEGWGDSGGDSEWGSAGGGRQNNRGGHRGRGGRGGRDNKSNFKTRENKDDIFSDKNNDWGSDNNNDWSDKTNGGNDGEWDSGDGGESKKRDYGGRGQRKYECHGSENGENNTNKRGGSRGGRGGRGGRGRSENGFNRGSFNNDNDDNGRGGNDEGWGRGRGRGGRGGRGGGRGGGFGGDDDGDGFGGGWGGDDGDSGRGRGRGGGRGRGRGGRGGDEWGEESGDGPEKPREIYVPPEPTNDLAEMFSTAISSGINFDKYDNIPVEVSGDNPVPPITSFDNSGMRPLILENIQRSGYSRPTPIQKTAIPIIMAGRDVMACAQTGSGKTAAFLLPIINCLIEDKAELIVDSSHVEPQVIIVSPTRELAIQIHEEARKFAYDTGLKCVIAYGGTSVGYQIKQLMNGCNILVATPGRMNDFVSRDRISFNSVRFVVLDEADRMLDMGFLPAVEQMLKHNSMVPTGERQTLMFSATFPEEVQRLAANYLNNYLFITIGIVGGACTDVQQMFHQVDKFKKRETLLELLRENLKEKTLVFVETKRNADFIASFLSENNLPTTSIHGDRQQREREEALRDFKHGRRNILVATDVAARGLDIKNVQHVINYDLPKSIDEYVHRIGRTGRVGNSGRATSFYDSSLDCSMAASLVKILRQATQNVPSWLQSAASGGYDSYNSDSFGGRDVRGNQSSISNQATEEPDEQW